MTALEKTLLLLLADWEGRFPFEEEWEAVLLPAGIKRYGDGWGGESRTGRYGERYWPQLNMAIGRLVKAGYVGKTNLVVTPLGYKVVRLFEEPDHFDPRLVSTDDIFSD